MNEELAQLISLVTHGDMDLVGSPEAATPPSSHGEIGDLSGGEW